MVQVAPHYLLLLKRCSARLIHPGAGYSHNCWYSEIRYHSLGLAGNTAKDVNTIFSRIDCFVNAVECG